MRPLAVFETQNTYILSIQTYLAKVFRYHTNIYPLFRVFYEENNSTLKGKIPVLQI